MSIERAGDRWTRDAPADRSRVFPAYACIPRTNDPDERLVNGYVVWDDYRVREYMVPGTCRFAEPVSIYSTERALGDDPDTMFIWGFDLRVERP